MRRSLAQADVLSAIIRTVNSSLEPARVADAVVSVLSPWIPASGWLVAVPAEDGRQRTLASRTVPEGFEGAAEAVSAWVLRTGEPFCSADAGLDARLADGDGSSSGAVVAVPLIARGATVGAVVAIDGVPSAREPGFSAASRPLLAAALEPGAIALDNALRIERAEALSVTDDLTQLYNSRYLSQVLRRETKRSSRSGRPLSLLFIDLDGFKSINDTHGHLFGSAALVEAAGVIRRSARETDIVARFGGDEFALVLPDTGSEGAAAVGERIRDKIAAHGFLRGEGLDIHLTVSVGVATLPDVAATAEQLIKAADHAMYWVKDHGKNGIHVAAAESEMPGRPG
jgi:diguanylate cyclase (GGDEF)-like protein